MPNEYKPMRKSFKRRKLPHKSFPLSQDISGLDLPSVRSLATIGIATIEELRDADLDFVVERVATLKYSLVKRWQQQAFLQTYFAGAGRKHAGLLVDAGLTTIKAVAEINVRQLRDKINEKHLRAWKFIAAHIPPTILPEQLETAQGIEPLAPPQAVALYAQGIRNLQNLRSAKLSSVNFNLLPTLDSTTFERWKCLADLRLDFGLGPDYAYQLYRRYAGNRDKIYRYLERRKAKALAEIMKKPPGKTRGRSVVP